MNDPSLTPIFNKPTVRGLLLWGLLFSIVLGFGLGLAQGFIGGSLEDPLWIMGIYIVLFTLLSLWLLQRFKQEGIQVRFIVGQRPERIRWWTIAGLILAALAFSLSSFLVAAAILSYQFPEFVEVLLQQLEAEATPKTANLLAYQVVSTIALLIVAPMTEEWIFRGFILQRWGVKWNLPLALLVSSIVFGLLHSNPIGLTVFGLVMGLLYIKTRSLLIPIAGHALNNLAALGMTFLPKDPNATTLSALRESLPAGIILLVLSAPWLVWFIAKNFPRRDAKIPYVLNAEKEGLGVRG